MKSELTTISAVTREYFSACSQHPKFNSAHEGWAIIKEELDELWEEVRKKKISRSKELMEKEAIQIAAMAIRFIVDVCLDPT